MELFHVDGNISDSEDPQKKANPFWQFRVAIKPTHENAIKAAEALGRLHQFQKNPHPYFKVFIPGEDNQLSSWDGTIEGADRDQRGKEICVYMDYSPNNPADFYENGYPKADYLKNLMLDIWHALEQAGVEMAYIAPGPGEKQVLVEDGTLTPFSYSSNKPWKGRHGILHSSEYNPLKFDDPLQGVTLLASDLTEHKIKPLKAENRIQRLVYQQQHHQEGLARAKADLNTPFEKDDVYASIVQRLTELVGKKGAVTAEEIKGFIEVLKEPNDKSLYHEAFYALGDCGNRIFKDAAANLLNNPAEAQKTLNSLFETIHTEKKTAVAEMMAVLPATSSINQAELEERFDRNPVAFHRLYQRFVLLAQENDTIQREQQSLEQFIQKTFPASYSKLDQDDSLIAARNLLNDYTKNNSGLSRAFTFHWFRHHTNEVNQIVEKIDSGVISSIDQLIGELKEIKLANAKGSLSRRIDFIVFRHAEAQANIAQADQAEIHNAEVEEPIDIVEDTQAFRI